MNEIIAKSLVAVHTHTHQHSSENKKNEYIK